MTSYQFLSAKEVREMKEDGVTDPTIAKRDKRSKNAIDDRLNNYVLPTYLAVNAGNKTPELRIVLVGTVRPFFRWLNVD